MLVQFVPSSDIVVAMLSALCDFPSHLSVCQ